MSYEVRYPKDKAPKVGVVANATNDFSLKGKEEAENQFRHLFNQLKEDGVISKDSIFFPDRIFGPNEAQKVTRLFAQETVDTIVVLDSGFPNGNTFLTIANDLYLSKVPLIVTAPLEIELEIPEWSTNAWCGVIMNNYVAKKINRHIFPLAGWPSNPEYQDKLRTLLNVAYTIKELRKDLLGRFGDAPGGFHSASGDQLDYAMTFGTRVETVDWTAVMETYRTGVARGYEGEFRFSEEDVKTTMDEMMRGRLVLVEDEIVEKAARLYHSFRAIIKANGFTSSAFRCWPEMIQDYIGIAPCFSMGWLLSKGEVTSAACEGDWPTAIAQSIGTLLSGKPSACLDFVNYTGRGPIVQLGHCGVGIAGLMAPNELPLEEVSEDIKEKVMRGKIKVNDAIAEKSPDRQGGKKVAPALIGQFEYGVKTGIDLIQDKDGKFKMLAFTGESRPETAKGLLYCAADVEVRNYSKLNELILEHGFSHHLAVAFRDITKELALLCDYYNIEYLLAD